MMEEDATVSARPPEAGAGARVIREIIRTPTFVELIKTNATGLEPARARELVRTLMFEDINLSLSLGGTTPEVINYLVEAVLEVGRQLNSFPAPLLDAFIDEIGASIDREKIAELPAVYGPLLTNVRARDRAASGTGSMITTLARAVRRAATNDPYFIRDAFANVDWREVAGAAFAVTRSVTLSIISVVSRLARGASGAIDKG